MEDKKQFIPKKLAQEECFCMSLKQENELTFIQLYVTPS